MTRNTLTYLGLKETERSNKAKEEQARNELLETMSNNLRNYKINITKNQIQKLANDQLNDREEKKIAETIRHQMEQDGIDKYSNEIKKLDAILSASKPSGRDVAALLTSYALNNHMLASLGLDSPLGNNINDLVKFISGWSFPAQGGNDGTSELNSRTSTRSNHQTTGSKVKNSYANPWLRESLQGRTASSSRDAMHNKAWRYDDGEQEESAMEYHYKGKTYTPQEFQKIREQEKQGSNQSVQGQADYKDGNLTSQSNSDHNSGSIVTKGVKFRESSGPGASIGIAFH